MTKPFNYPLVKPESWTLFLCTVNFVPFFVLFLQKLLDEIENNKDKVDECQEYAKAYIDTIKVNITCFLYCR